MSLRGLTNSLRQLAYFNPLGSTLGGVLVRTACSGAGSFIVNQQDKQVRQVERAVGDRIRLALSPSSRSMPQVATRSYFLRNIAVATTLTSAVTGAIEVHASHKIINCTSMIACELAEKTHSTVSVISKLSAIASWLLIAPQTMNQAAASVYQGLLHND